MTRSGTGLPRPAELPTRETVSAQHLARSVSAALALVALGASVANDASAQVHVDLTSRTASGSIGEEIVDIRYATELADGRLLFTSRPGTTPSLADFATGRLQSVSKEGDGPGEFRRPFTVLRLASDSTAIVEDGGHRWVVLKGVTPVATLRARGAAAMAIILAGADTFGRVLEISATKMGTEPGQRVYLSHTNAESLAVLVHYRSAIESGNAFGSRVDTISRLRGRFRGVRNRRHTPRGTNMSIEFHLSQPLAAEEQALLFNDGWIAFAYPDPYRVTWRTPEGKLVAGAPLPFTAVVVDDVQKRAAITAEWSSGPAPFGASDYPPWPRVLPPFLVQSLLALPNGTLAIKRAPDGRRPGVNYDIVDRRGGLAGTIQVGPNEKIVAFGKASVYVARHNADGLIRLLRYSWPN